MRAKDVAHVEAREAVAEAASVVAAALVVAEAAIATISREKVMT